MAHSRAHVVHQLHAAEGLVPEVLLLVAVQLEVVLEVLVGGEQEAAGAAGRVGDDLARLGLDAVDDRLDHARGA